MKNNDQILLENIYDKIIRKTLNEMAFGLGVGGTPMTIQEIMDFVASKDEEGGDRVIPMSLTTITKPRIRKRDFPYKDLYKITQTVVELTGYEKKVNRELKKQGEEGEFTAQSSRVVKERISRSVGISKRDLPLLMFDQTQIKQSTSLFVVRKEDEELSYIAKEEAVSYMPPPSPSATGTSVKWRTYGIDKIIGLRIDGREIINSEVDSDKMEVFDFVKDKLKS